MSKQFDGLLPGDRVYIAGPMRGIEYFNFPAFDAARDRLRKFGLNAISPADMDRAIGFDPNQIANPEGYDWRDLNKVGFNLRDALDRDVAALKECDAIYLLDGWEGSKGAQAEKAVAEWLGLKVVYQSEPLKAEFVAKRLARRVFGLVDDPQTDEQSDEVTADRLRVVQSGVAALAEGQTEVNEAGGKQSFIAARFDCIPAICQRLLAQCLGFGARKYGKENWQKIPIEDNLAHAINHLNEWRLGDRSEPHLVNTLARVNFALWQAVQSGDQAEQYIHPDMIASGEGS